jgi:hypothetical protein
MFQGRVDQCPRIFVAFLTYCLYVTLARRLNPLAPGLTARSVLEKFSGPAGGLATKMGWAGG